MKADYLGTVLPSRDAGDEHTRVVASTHEKPAMLFKPYVYRGTGADQFPETAENQRETGDSEGSFGGLHSGIR